MAKRRFRRRFSIEEKVAYHQKKAKTPTGVYSRFWLHGVTDENYAHNLAPAQQKCDSLRSNKNASKSDRQVAFGYRNGLRNAEAFEKSLWKKHGNYRGVETELHIVRWGKEPNLGKK